MKVSARESGAVGTAPRAVRNDALVMLRRRFIAARSAIAPYHLSHWVQYAVSCCLCCFLVFISSVAFAAPRLIVPSEGVAFGEVAVGSNVVGKVVLRNEGSTTVSVSRVKACCGAKAELSSPKIPPKGSATLSVSLTPQEIGAFSSRFKLHATIQSVRSCPCPFPAWSLRRQPQKGAVCRPARTLSGLFSRRSSASARHFSYGGGVGGFPPDAALKASAALALADSSPTRGR